MDNLPEYQEPTENQIETPANEQDVDLNETSSEIMELDGVSRFKFQGKEYSPEDLGSVFKENEGYKTSAESFQKESDYINNLSADLSAVVKNPALADQFRQIYPAKYHKFLTFVEGKMEQNKQESFDAKGEQKANADLLKKLDELNAKVKSFEDHFAKSNETTYQREVEAQGKWLDAQFSAGKEKYKLMSEEEVLNRAAAFSQKGNTLNEATIQRFMRESHERNEKKWNDYSKAQLKLQSQKAKKGLDTGGGGVAPGHSPRRMRLDEVADHAIKTLTGR